MPVFINLALLYPAVYDKHSHDNDYQTMQPYMNIDRLCILILPNLNNNASGNLRVVLMFPGKGILSSMQG